MPFEYFCVDLACVRTKAEELDQFSKWVDAGGSAREWAVTRGEMSPTLDFLRAVWSVEQTASDREIDPADRCGRASHG
jgi:hypothetical protein